MNKLLKETVEECYGMIESGAILFESYEDYYVFFEEMGYPDYTIIGDSVKYEGFTWLTLEIDDNEYSVYVKGVK